MATATAFEMTLDDLTNAIFNGSSLPTRGTGTKSEAREQARLMLAAQGLLEALRQLRDKASTVCDAATWSRLEQEVYAANAAIAKAQGCD